MSRTVSLAFARVRASRRALLCISLGLTSAIASACGGSSGGPTTPTPPVVPPPVAPNPDANLPGRIVYTGGRLHVYTVATRSDVNLGVLGVNPKFSPDGLEIVYQHAGGISIMSADGSAQRLLSPTGGVPSWDPSGKIIAFGNRESGIWKVNANGTGLVQVTFDGGFQPAWSPDGTRIAYNATVSGVGQQLYIVNADGSNPQRVLTSKPVIDVVWRPSSKILLGVLVEDLNYEVHSYDPAVTTSLTRLTTKTDNDFEPSWSPNGQYISWSNVSGGLWIMKADGSDQHQVVAGARQGSWGQ